MRRILLTGLLLLVLVSPARGFSLTSKAFDANNAIPREYTCQGIDVSPQLAWSGTPAGTKSFVLIVEDPDVPDPAAPTRTWVHWVLYDISGAATELQAVGTLYEASPRPSSATAEVEDTPGSDA